MNDILDYVINQSPNGLFLLFINCVVYYLRKTRLRNELLPTFAALIGGVGFLFIGDTSEVPYNVKNVEVHKFVVGAILGFAAVGVHQHAKNVVALIAKKNNEGTTFLEKPNTKKD